MSTLHFSIAILLQYLLSLAPFWLYYCCLLYALFLGLLHHSFISQYDNVSNQKKTKKTGGGECLTMWLWNKPLEMNTRIVLNLISHLYFPHEQECMRM